MLSREGGFFSAGTVDALMRDAESVGKPNYIKVTLAAAVLARQGRV